MYRFTFCFALLLAAFAAPAVHAADRPPNVIVIFTDNQGAWTLGCYGNKDIHTPNIDRMAAEGVRFEYAFANNPVCSPNRATLLTGLMPSRHGVHCYMRAGASQTGPDSKCLISEFPTLPRILKARGYDCGMIGKWHLGGNMTPQEGFTDEWVTMPHGSTATFFDADVIENNAIRKEPMHLTQYWTKRALQFIDKEKDKPFFLYLPYNGPYGLGPAQLKDKERAPHWNDYANQDLPSFPRLPMHPWQFNNKEYLNNIDCIRRYAAEVTTIDDGVGEIMAKLRALHLDKNTVVIFAGDNGWSGGQNGLWGMGDHTRPLTAFDAQMRVPLLWWQPGRIAAGKVATSNVSHLNFMPTLLDYLGFASDVPSSAKLTGRAYTPLLRGEAMPDWDDTVIYEFENMRCFRTPTEKFIERFEDEVDEHYDLAKDPGEEHNLLTPTTHHSALSAKLDTLFKPNTDPRFDLWHGGKSKVEAHVFPKTADRSPAK